MKKEGRQQSTELHHYTTEQGLEGIIASKQIFASTKAKRAKDARYGNGQYLTDIKPNTYSPEKLSMKLFGGPHSFKRCEHFISIDVTALEVDSPVKYIFVVPNEDPLDISDIINASGENIGPPSEKSEEVA
ncbi:HYD1 signature containing ADP-ribosyltransferase family protein [Vibrio owensii]|uniref:HYD1 signature containing ADP-ribosyltransferase family protein n=1 Tax=Vibrio owensii TaxID=696485 RepID=UPI003DA139C1